MRSKLSYYSVLLLIGLAIASGLILVINPFNGAPASASPGAQTVGTTGAATTNSTSAATSSTAGAPFQTRGAFGDGSENGGTFDGDHGQNSQYPGLGGASGNSTVTTTTSVIYSVDE